MISPKTYDLNDLNDLNELNELNGLNVLNDQDFAGSAFLINSRMLSNSSIHSVVIHR